MAAVILSWSATKMSSRSCLRVSSERKTQCTFRGEADSQSFTSAVRLKSGYAIDKFGRSTTAMTLSQPVNASE